VLWGIIGLSGIGGWAADNELTRATLRGVRGLEVLVESLEPTVEQAGLTRQQLQTDVELRLRKAGIHVLTRREAFAVLGAPCLEINLNILLRPNGSVSYNIHVELYQDASLKTDGSLAIVSTWSVGAIGSVGSTGFIDAIRSHVRDEVDEFINAYLSVHPLPIGSATPSSMSPRRDLIR